MRRVTPQNKQISDAELIQAYQEEFGDFSGFESIKLDDLDEAVQNNSKKNKPESQVKSLKMQQNRTSTLRTSTKEQKPGVRGRLDSNIKEQSYLSHGSKGSKHSRNGSAKNSRNSAFLDNEGQKKQVQPQKKLKKASKLFRGLESSSQLIRQSSVDMNLMFSHLHLENDTDDDEDIGIEFKISQFFNYENLERFR